MELPSKLDSSQALQKLLLVLHIIEFVFDTPELKFQIISALVRTFHSFTRQRLTCTMATAPHQVR